jgi:MFS family permease
MTAELQASGDFRTHENPTTRNLPIALPDDTNKGWLGLGWLLLAMVPAAIGGGVLQPSINSLITKRVEREDTGGMLGISAAFLSGANAIAPLIGGAIFLAFGARMPFLLGGLRGPVLALSYGLGWGRMSFRRHSAHLPRLISQKAPGMQVCNPAPFSGFLYYFPRGFSCTNCRAYLASE